MQECVDRIGTLHHDHVAPVLKDLQESYEKDLTEKQNRFDDLGIISNLLPSDILCHCTDLALL